MTQNHYLKSKYDIRLIPRWVPQEARIDLEGYFLGRVSAPPVTLERIWRFLTDDRMENVWKPFSHLTEGNTPKRVNLLVKI